MPQSNLSKYLGPVQEYSDGGWGNPQNPPAQNLTDKGYPSSMGGYGNTGSNYVPNTNYNQTRPYSNPNYAFNTPNNGLGMGVVTPTTPTNPNYGGGYGGTSAQANTPSYGGGGGGSYSYDEPIAPVGSDAYFQQLLKLYNAQTGSNANLYNSASKYASSTKKTADKNANKTYNRTINLLKSNLKSAKNTLSTNNQSAIDKMNTTANEDLRQAYINSMMQQRGLDQAMAAQGMNGGMTETTRASMANSYGNNRNAINMKLAENIADQNLAYNNALADLQSQYNADAVSANNARTNALSSAAEAYNQAMYQAQLQQEQNNAAAYQDFLKNTFNAINAGDINSTAIQNAYNEYIKQQQKKNNNKKSASKLKDLEVTHPEVKYNAPIILKK